MIQLRKAQNSEAVKICFEDFPAIIIPHSHFTSVKCATTSQASGSTLASLRFNKHVSEKRSRFSSLVLCLLYHKSEGFWYNCACAFPSYARKNTHARSIPRRRRIINALVFIIPHSERKYQKYFIIWKSINCYATIHIGQPHKKGRRIWPHVLKLNHHKQLSERRPDPSCLTV